MRWLTQAEALREMASVRTHSKLDAALRYAELGVPIFPCASLLPQRVTGEWPCSCGHPMCIWERGWSGKHPYPPLSYLEATIEPAQIRGWWGNAPTANVVTPTGKAFGHFVLDVDHLDYRAVVGWLARRYGIRRPLAMAKTGRGGVHLHYAYPCGEQLGSLLLETSSEGLVYRPKDPSEIPTGNLNPEGHDVDLNGDRNDPPKPCAWVILPPSTTVGPYRWLDLDAEWGRGTNLPSNGPKDWKSA